MFIKVLGRLIVSFTCCICKNALDLVFFRREITVVRRRKEKTGKGEGKYEMGKKSQPTYLIIPSMLLVFLHSSRRLDVSTDVHTYLPIYLPYFDLLEFIFSSTHSLTVFPSFLTYFLPRIVLRARSFSARWKGFCFLGSLFFFFFLAFLFSS